MVNSRAEAEAFVGACRYAPQGYRSAGPTRVNVYAGSDYLQHANESIVTLAMIETAQALQNVDEIMSTPGLGRYLCWADRSCDQPGVASRGTWRNRIWTKRYARSWRPRVNNGIAPGIHTSATDDSNRMIERGFKFVTVLSDTSLLADAARNAVKTVRAKGVSGR